MVEKDLVEKYGDSWTISGYELAHVSKDTVRKIITDSDDFEHVWSAVLELRTLKVMQVF